MNPAIEYKYDGYFKKEIPYRMTMEELSKLDYLTDAHILAYIRYIGIEYMTILALPQSLMSGSAEDGRVICKILSDDNSLYNPLSENHSQIHENHWYSPYKIKYMPVEFEECEKYVKIMYFSDFCQNVRDGHVELIEHSLMV